MFAKETKKIKRLTRKLNETGDISEDEADWIYIMNVLPWDNHCTTRYKIRNFWVSSSSLNPLRSAFSDWYTAVEKKIRNKETGNFLSTVSLLKPFNYPADLKDTIHWRIDTNKYFASPAFLLQNKNRLLGDVLHLPDGCICFSRAGVEERVMGKTRQVGNPSLFRSFWKKFPSDTEIFEIGVKYAVMSLMNIPVVVDPLGLAVYPAEYEQTVNEIFSLSREAVLNTSLPYISFVRDTCYFPDPRYADGREKIRKIASDIIEKTKMKPFVLPKETQTKDIAFLKNAANTVQARMDITPEEADNIYLLFKYAQSLKLKEKTLKNSDPIRASVEQQAETLFEHLNKWYKVVYNAVKQGRRGNFETTLPSYPGCDMHKPGANIKRSLKLLPKECFRVIFPNLKEFDFDKYDSAGFNFGIFGEEGRYITAAGFRYGLMQKIFDVNNYAVIAEDYDTYFEWYEGRKKSYRPVLYAKLEAIRQAGVSPVLVYFGSKLGDYAIVVPAKDYSKIQHILDIDESSMPDFKNLEECIKTVAKLAEINRRKEEEAFEDDWIIER